MTGGSSSSRKESNVQKMIMTIIRTTKSRTLSKTARAWLMSFMLLAMAFLSLPMATTLRTISSRLMSPFWSASMASKHSSASWRWAGPMTSTTSSSERASRPSTTKDIQMRRAMASDDRTFSSASTTTECAELGLKTCLPVISEAMLPKADVILSPRRPTSPTRRMGRSAAAPEPAPEPPLALERSTRSIESLMT